MNEPLVSIIVPVYNVEKYFHSCVNSIINQSYNNLDVILVDDGSTDNSGKLCDEAAKTDKRIRVIHQSNQGLSGARNSGIEVAQGDYLFFLDSDDFLTTKAIESLIEISDKFDADLTVCDNVRCSDLDSYEDFVVKQNSPNIDTEIIEKSKKMKIFLTESKIKVVAWGKLYKKYLFNNVRFPVGRYNEDNFTTYKIVHSAEKIVVTNFKGYVYRVSASSITHQTFKRKHWDDTLGKLEQLFFIEKNYPELKGYAQASVVYACNQVLFLMGCSGNKEMDIIHEMKSYYRLYEKDYLFSNANFAGKLFSVIAFINPLLALGLANFIHKIKN